MKRIIYIIPILLVVSLLTPRCAKIVAPSGGPRDTIPPVLVGTSPPMHTTNFSGSRITLAFDEFVQPRELIQKMVLSPPQEQPPNYILRGKRIEFRFSEPLQENTTYTLYLADAVADNNEGNRIPYLEFAFSTGPEIDTLSFSGQVIDAFTLEPIEGVLVMLYESMDDSLPIKELPRHVAKTYNDGSFTLNNIGKQSYKIFALNDQNRNYLFDQITEAVAFYPNPIADSILTPRRTPFDTSLTYVPQPSQLTLRMFTEESPVQVLTDFKREKRRCIELGFTKKPEGGVTISPVGLAPQEPWYILERNARGDTLRYWITDRDISQIDTLSIEANYFRTDSLFNLYPTTDTLRVFYFPRQTPERRTSRFRQEEEEKEPRIAVSTSPASRAIIFPHQPFVINFPQPLLEVNEGMISIMNVTDSVYVNNYSFSPDSLNPRRYTIEYPWEYSANYNVKLPQGAFMDLDSLVNDTLVVNVRGAKPEDYATIKLKLQGVTPDVIVELLLERGAVANSQAVSSDTTLSFQYLRPGNYYFRFTEDVNRDGVWTTGNYLQGRPPERVSIWKEDDKPRLITVRANWEYNENHSIEWPTEF